MSAIPPNRFVSAGSAPASFAIRRMSQQPLRAGVEEHVVEAVVAQVDVRARVHERPHGVGPARDGRDHHRRAAVGVLGIDRQAGGEEPLDARPRRRPRRPRGVAGRSSWTLLHWVAGDGFGGRRAGRRTAAGDRDEDDRRAGDRSCPPGPHVGPIMLRAMTTDARPRRNYLPADVPPIDLDRRRPARATSRRRPASGSTRPRGRTTRAARTTSTSSRDTLAAWDALPAAAARAHRRVAHRPLDVDPRPPGRAARRDRTGGDARPRPPRRRARDGPGRGGRGRDPRRVDGREPHDRGRRRGGTRRPALVPALRPARPARDPRPRPAGRGGRLRGALPHGRPAGPRLPRRDPPAALRPGRGRVREPPASATSGGPTADSTRRWTCAASELTWDALEEIRSWAPLPLVLKGILTARGRPARRGARRRRDLGLATTAAGSSIASRRASTCWRRSWTRSRGAPRSTSTAGSGADRRSSSRSRSGPAPCSRRGRSCGRSRAPARPA